MVIPERNEGNRRMYSLNNIDKLLEVKDYLAEGINMAGIKQIYAERAQEEAKRQAKREKSLTDADVRRILRDEFVAVSGLSKQNQFSFRNNGL